MRLANQANETPLLWPVKILGLFIFYWPFPASIESLTYSLYYSSLVSHLHGFRGKIKEYIKRNVVFDLELCGRAAILKGAIVDIFFDNIARYYYHFILKMMNRKANLPKDHDDLQLIANVTSKRYSNIT